MRKKRNRYRPDKAQRRKLIRHWFLVILGFGALMGAVLLLSGALAYSYKAILGSSWFKVSEIQILGLKNLDRSEILDAMMLPPEASLLALKASQLAERLESLPLVKKSVVRFQLPGTILVEVTEKEPLVVVHGKDFMLVDEHGRLVSRASPEQREKFLTVEGFADSELKEGDQLPAAPLRALKELLSALDQTKNWLPANSIAECRWGVETGLLVYPSYKNIAVRLGWRDFDVKLERLRGIFKILEERQLWNSVISIDLDYSNRAYIEGLTPLTKMN